MLLKKDYYYPYQNEKQIDQSSIKLFIDDFDTNRCRKCSLKVQKVPAGIF